MNSPLKYRTFDQLLNDAGVDMPTLHQEGYIRPEQLIKVAMRVNYDLGLRIHQEKLAVLNIERHRCRLPDDFYVFNYGMVCLQFHIEEPIITGSQTEEVILCPLPEGTDPCNCSPKPCITRCGEHVYLKQTFKSQIRVYDAFAPIRIKPSREVAPGCPNLSIHCLDEAVIKSGWLQTNFDSATICINYLGNLEDENGELLVVDHPRLNEYYEYAIKQRVLENMLLEREPVADALSLIEKRLTPARNNALSLVNTPDFRELKETWEMNRRTMLKRYYDIFI